MYVCLTASLYIWIYVYIYIYARMYVYMYVFMYGCMYVCMLVCMYVCMSGGAGGLPLPEGLGPLWLFDSDPIQVALCYGSGGSRGFHLTGFWPLHARPVGGLCLRVSSFL